MLPFGQILSHLENELQGLVQLRLHVVQRRLDRYDRNGQDDVALEERVLDLLLDHLTAHVLVRLLKPLLDGVKRELGALDERVVATLQVEREKVEIGTGQTVLASLSAVLVLALGGAFVVLGLAELDR